MEFEFIKQNISEVILIKPSIFEDERGSFAETYRKSAFLEAGITDNFIQDNSAFSKQYVLRGLHYQAEPKAMAKLVRVVAGEILDVAVDIRKSSASFGKYISAILSSNNNHQLYIPKGFAHGYLVLSPSATVVYKTSCEYSQAHDFGILYSDPDINIDWGKAEFIVSEKDKKQPRLKDL